MSATFYFDEPIDNTLASDNNNKNLPRDSRNFAREKLATVSGTIAFDSSYPTGGYAVSPPKFGMKVVEGVLFSHPQGYVVTYNASTDKIQVTDQGTVAGALPEVAATTNLTALSAVYFEAKGRQY